MASGNSSLANIAIIKPRVSSDVVQLTNDKPRSTELSADRQEVENFDYASRMSPTDHRVALRTVFGVVSDRGSQQPIIDMIAERDRKIESLLSQLAIEQKERAIMEGAYNASLNRLRQAVVNQTDLSAAEAAAEGRLLAREMELERLQKDWYSEKEKLITDLEEALRQRDDSLLRQRDLEQRLVIIDQKNRERSVKFVQIKEKYERAKERVREYSENTKKMDHYLSSLPTTEELQKVQDENKLLLRENASLKDRGEKLFTDLEKLRSVKQDLESMMAKQSTTIVELEAEVKHLRNELEPVLKLSSNRAALADKSPDVQIGVYQKIVAELEKEVDKQKQIAQLYSSQLQIQKKATEDTRNELLSKIAKNEEDIRILQSEIEIKDRESARLKADVRKLQTSNQDNLVLIEELRQRVRNFDSLASGDAGVLHEALVEKMYRCVDKCKRLETALSHLIQAALPNKPVCTAMANSIDVTELLSTTVPVVVFENDLDTSAKLQALLNHSDVIGNRLDETHNSVIGALAAVQAEAFPW